MEKFDLIEKLTKKITDKANTEISSLERRFKDYEQVDPTANLYKHQFGKYFYFDFNQNDMIEADTNRIVGYLMDSILNFKVIINVEDIKKNVGIS